MTECERKTYTIVAGVHGVGKSSLMGILSTVMGNFKEMIDINYLDKEKCCIQETTLSDHKIFANVRKAKTKGYYIRLYYVGLDTVEESIIRIRNRVKKGGHEVEESNVKQQFDNRFQDLCAILQHCDEAIFYDNENGFVAVAEYKNGKILEIGSLKPKWLKEMINCMV